MGHDDNARKVAMEKQRLMIPVRFQEAPWYAKHTVWALWHLHCFTSGFGYRPSRLIIILLVLWFTGGLFFAKAAEFGVFEPTDRQVRADQTLRVCRIKLDPMRRGEHCRVPDPWPIQPTISCLPLI